MEKNILLELKRIQNLMDYDRAKGTLIIEDAMGAERRQRAIDKEILSGTYQGGGKSVTDKKETFKIGKDTEYPFIYYQGIPEMDTFKVVEGTEVFLIKSETTSKNLIGNVQVGSITNAEGEVIENQEYVVKKVSIKKEGVVVEEDRKLCLPDKSFWQLPTIQGKAYKFVVPVKSSGSGFSVSGIESSKKTFAMAMALKKTQPNAINAEGIEVAQTGLQVAIKCKGGDNGWGFVLTPPLFFNTETGAGYNPQNPEDLDDRSEWEVWYSHYGGWLEVGVGIAASFLGAGLAGFLLRSAAGSTGAFFTFMSSTYAGGSTTMASVFLQVICEGVMMGPIIKWQMANDKGADAMINSLFLLIPFVSETKAVSKYISGRYGKETSKALVDKMSNVGLKRIFDMAKAGQQTAVIDFQAFITSLTGTELALFQEGMAMFAKKEGIDSLQEGFQELVKSGGALEKEWLNALSEGAAGTKRFLENLGLVVSEKTAINAKKVANVAAKYFNPITAKTVLPGQLVRMGVPIAAVATGLKLGYKALFPPEQKKFEANFSAWTENSDYINSLNSIDPYFVELTITRAMEKITSDETTARNYANKLDWAGDPELKKIYDQAGKEIIEERGKEYVTMLGPEFQSNVALLRLKMTFIASCTVKLSLIGLTIKKWESMPDDLTLSTAIVTRDEDKKEFKLEIKNNSGKVEYYIDGTLVPESDFTSKSWKPTEIQYNPKIEIDKKIKNENFYIKKNILRNINNH